jgi:hypothetical protein
MVELLDLVPSELEFHGGKVVTQLVEPFRPDDDRRDDRLGEQPRERDPGRATAVRPRDRCDHAEIKERMVAPASIAQPRSPQYRDFRLNGLVSRHAVTIYHVIE